MWRIGLGRLTIYRWIDSGILEMKKNDISYTKVVYKESLDGRCNKGSKDQISKKNKKETRMLGMW